MRKGDDFVLVSPDLSIMNVISRMTSARAGAVIVVEANGVLAGIFTQGDFARAFQSGKPDIGAQSVAHFMTRNPVSVHEDKLVGEVLRILEDSRIDDLVVLNDARIPLGIIDTQDLTRLQIV
mgnify:FL=1